MLYLTVELHMCHLGIPAKAAVAHEGVLYTSAVKSICMARICNTPVLECPPNKGSGLWECWRSIRLKTKKEKTKNFLSPETSDFANV